MVWAPTVALALLAALVFGTLARRLGHSPLLGYLLAGIVIGPHTPGFVGDAALAGQLADVGVVLLMFGVGLGFSFADLWSVRRLAVPGALLASGTVVLLGTGMGLSLGWPLGGAAVLGMCLATASTVVIVRGMTELGLLAAAPGRIAVGWSLVEDLITVVLLVVLPAMAPAAAAGAPAAVPLWQALAVSLGKVVLLAAVVVWGGGRVVPRLLGWVAQAQSRELFTLAVLTVALGVAFLAAEGFGVSLALGAFFGGMVVGRSDLAHQAAADALPMRDAFAVLFFVAVGMLFDPYYVLQEPLAVLAALVCVLVAKPLVAVLLLLGRGQAPRTAFSVSAGLAQVSEFSFVLAGLATGLGILPAGGRDLVLATALVSILVSPLLFRGVPVLERWLSRRPAYVRRHMVRTAELSELRPAQAGGLDQHVVLVGYGRVGSVLGGFLTARGVPFVVVELDRPTVRRLREQGVPALYGDASSPVLLDRAEVQRARALVLTTPDAVSQRLAIEHARRVQPGIEIVARVHSGAQLAELQAVDRARPVHGERELGFAMARQLLEALGASTIEAEAVVLGAGRGDQGAADAPRLFEVPVPAGAAVVGRTLAELQLPATALVVAVVRGGVHLVARGPSTLAAGDTLLLFAGSDDARVVERLVAAPAGAPAGPVVDA
ncbi:MAG: cation:proton antiporter [Planctomycetes bacterium]|nr:cation:proton antiporter [Planctomycetota bacterium]